MKSLSDLLVGALWQAAMPLSKDEPATKATKHALTSPETDSQPAQAQVNPA